MRGAVPASLGPVKHGMICACLGRIALGVLLGLIGTAGPVAASPWTKPAASYYLNLSYARIRASTYFDSVGAVRDLSAPYSQQVLALYAEVGVVDRWLTVVADWKTLRSVSQADFQ